MMGIWQKNKQTNKQIILYIILMCQIIKGSTKSCIVVIGDEKRRMYLIEILF